MELCEIPANEKNKNKKKLAIESFHTGQNKIYDYFMQYDMILLFQSLQSIRKVSVTGQLF